MVADDEEKPLACWPGTDRHEGREVKTLTVILKSGGCSWNRCLMCSYRHERYGPMAPEELSSRIIRQLVYVRRNFSLEDTEIVKIYTSGSFFDPREVPPAAVLEAGRLFRGKIVIAETRPEYVDKDVLAEFTSEIDTGVHRRPLYVAMGLETTNDAIRSKSIDKGFSYGDYTAAVHEARSAGAGIKAYLLLKPLFLTETEAVEDMKQSLRDLEGHADMISMNVSTIQRGTAMERYWKQGAYRPPYLWSVLDVLASAPMEVLCDPLGGGYSRGAHNCGECDRPIVDSIRHYSLTGDRGVIRSAQAISCPCREEYDFVRDQEKSWCMPLTR